MEKAALRGADITKRLLMFSSFQKLNPKQTSLNDTIKNIIDMIARGIGPEIEIKLKLSDSIPPVKIDVSEFDTCLLNIALNARDAMPKGGILTISTNLAFLEESYPPVQMKELKSGTYVKISVSDTGTGMPQEILERVFEPFFTTKPHGKGTGLGLSLVYGFAKQSGGYVRIYSELGYGTKISLYLPLLENTLIALQPISSARPEFKTAGVALVVDDEIELLEIAAAYLEEVGFHVFKAKNAENALEIVEREKNIDLLVTDVVMPGMNGIELAERIHHKIPNIIIVYSSGFPSTHLSESKGIIVNRPLISKPYQRKEFSITIRDAMNGNLHKLADSDKENSS